MIYLKKTPKNTKGNDEKYHSGYNSALPRYFADELGLPDAKTKFRVIANSWTPGALLMDLLTSEEPESYTPN